MTSMHTFISTCSDQEPPFRVQREAWMPTDDIHCPGPQTCFGCCYNYPSTDNCASCDRFNDLVIQCSKYIQFAEYWCLTYRHYPRNPGFFATVQPQLFGPRLSGSSIMCTRFDPAKVLVCMRRGRDRLYKMDAMITERRCWARLWAGKCWK